MLKGKDGIVYVDNPKVRLGAVQNWNLDEQADVVSGWGMGDQAETSFTTITRYSGSTEVYLDFADASDDISVGDVLPAEFYPGGEGSGSGYFSGNILVTGLARSAAKDGIVALSINFRNASGTLTKGTVA